MRKVKNKSRLFLGLKRAPVDVNNASVIFHYGPTYEDSKTFPLTDFQNVFKHQNYDNEKKTVLYVFGYAESTSVESVHLIVDSYLNRGDHNILVLDWTELANGNYIFDAFINARQLGIKIAKIMLDINRNVDISNIHLVGHSLGGQMVGIIGREVIKRSNQTVKFKRISALDPAFPPFYFGVVSHLSQKDAEFVDVIHTDAWFYGAPISTGTADFWPNGGKSLQPGCPPRNYKLLTDNDLCSHRRSWWFWAESVSAKYPAKFKAIQAKSWKSFKSGDCLKLEKEVVMGIDCPTTISGDFYLQTNGDQPFAKGDQGVIYLSCSNEEKLTLIEDN